MKKSAVTNMSLKKATGPFWMRGAAGRAICRRARLVLALATLALAPARALAADAPSTPDCYITIPQAVGVAPIEVCVSRAALVQANQADGEILDVQIADERICLRVLRPARGAIFEIIGLAEGTTTATVWQRIAGAAAVPKVVNVRVTYPCDEFERLVQAVNGDLNPPASTPITITRVPVSGKILVKGRVQHCAQIEQIRKLIGGAEIDATRLVFEVTSVTRPCCNCRRPLFPR